MDTNGLYQVALSDADDDTILKAFLRAKLPDRLVEDFFAFFDVVKSPIAIRSSSLLEDSHYPPFADFFIYISTILFLLGECPINKFNFPHPVYIFFL